jgi:lipoprotein-releasing system ATP-binding protein
MIELTNVSKSYPGPEGGEPLSILKDVNFKLPTGSSAAIVGPSGSGKSTLLNIIGALDTPTSGEVKVNGQDLAKLAPKEAAAYRNQTVGFIFQLHHLLPQCTVLENVLIPAMAGHSKETPSALNQRARTLLEKVGLSARATHRPGELSGGERQRVAIARSLINQPKLLLADEPTGALDQGNSGNLLDVLLGLQKDQNLTLLVVTHAPDVAKKLQDVYVVENTSLKKI